MWTRSKETSTMGVQAVSSPSKRKQDFDADKDKKYLGASPVKHSKWSNNTASPNRSNNVESVDNIALLEALSGISCEPWNIEPTDNISRLQAITVPDDPWGSNSNNKSTFGTSILDFEDVDVDENDFDDDYEKEQTITPYYGLKYHCSPQRVCSPSLHGYIKASFYSDSFLQHNGSKIPPNSIIKMGNFSWGNNSNNYFTPNESSYSQQIKCAENGKSYLELGNSNFNPTMDAKRPKKCCDGRGAWCNGKSCYKEIRLRVRSISMFKLSRFRQISEQSLYRSVLICNTLKQIEKEIDSDNRESNNKLNTQFPISQGIESIKPLSNNTLELLETDFEQSSTSSYTTLNTSMENKNFRYSYNQKSNMSLSNSQFYCNDSLSTQPQDYYSFRDPQSGRATPFPSSAYNNNTDCDSGYGDDESSRPINWSSVLSLSSQSALDPINNNDLFSTLPSVSSTTDSVPSQIENSTQQYSNSNSNSPIISNSSSNQTTTLTTLSSSPSSISSSATLEYNFLDMDLGLGQEFTELSPTSCKFSSSDMFKTISSSLNSNKYNYENDLEPPTHIMVGS